jgi:hypothetical protein
MTYKEKYLLVSIINNIIELYCNETDFTLDENPIKTYGIGVTNEGELLSANGDSLEDIFGWVLDEIVPQLKIK